MTSMLAFFYWDPYFWITIPGALLAMWAQMRLRSVYGQYSRVATGRGITGAQAARHILDRNGLRDVELYETGGHLTDHYDPSKRAVFLSAENSRSTSVAAVGVAAHEVGHALQHALGYGPLGLRMALVGVTGFASSAAWFIILAGVVLSGMAGGGGGLGRLLLLGGVFLFSVVVFFQLVTLPVEYDASRRAHQQLVALGLVTQAEAPGVRRVLNAAALTYLAALATAVLELIRILLLARHSNSDR